MQMQYVLPALRSKPTAAHSIILAPNQHNNAQHTHTTSYKQHTRYNTHTAAESQETLHNDSQPAQVK